MTLHSYETAGGLCSQRHFFYSYLVAIMRQSAYFYVFWSSSLHCESVCTLRIGAAV